MEQLKLILEWVCGLLGGGTGATIIALLIKHVVDKRAEVKVAQSSTLSEAQIDAIADRTAKKVEKNIKGKITIDIDAQLDRATNKRISAIEEQQGKIVDAVNRTANYSRATMSAIGSFRSIPVASQQEIAKLAKDAPAQVEEQEKPIVELVGDEVKVEEKKLDLKY